MTSWGLEAYGFRLEVLGCRVYFRVVGFRRVFQASGFRACCFLFHEATV